MLRTRHKICCVFLFLSLIPSCFALTVHFNPSDPVSGIIHAKITYRIVSITFDDGWQTQLDYAVPLLEAHGYKATFYVSPWFAANFPQYMDFAELQTVQALGHEIGSHGYYHPDYTTIDETRIRWELSTSKQLLESNGLNVTDFAYPEGKSNAFTDALVLEYYASARNGFTPPYRMNYPTNQTSLPCWADITDGTSILPTLKSLVDEVAAEGGWTIINFHNIAPHPSEWQPNTPPEVFEAFLSYLGEKNITVLTVREALEGA